MLPSESARLASRPCLCISPGEGLQRQDAAPMHPLHHPLVGPPAAPPDCPRCASDFPLPPYAGWADQFHAVMPVCPCAWPPFLLPSPPPRLVPRADRSHTTRTLSTLDSPPVTRFPVLQPFSPPRHTSCSNTVFSSPIFSTLIQDSIVDRLPCASSIDCYQPFLRNPPPSTIDTSSSS